MDKLDVCVCLGTNSICYNRARICAEHTTATTKRRQFLKRKKIRFRK